MTPNPLKELLNNRMIVVVSAIALGVLGLSTYLMMNPIGAKPKVAESANQSTDKNPVGGIGALGRLEPEGEVFRVAAPATGFSARVLEVRVKEGEVVKKGQPIAVMDSAPSLEAALIQAQAQVREAEAKLAQVLAGSKQGDRGEKSVAVRQAEIAEKEADASLQQARANAQTAGTEMKKREIDLMRAQRLCAFDAETGIKANPKLIQAPQESSKSTEAQGQIRKSVNGDCRNGAISDAEVLTLLQAVQAQQAQFKQSLALVNEREQAVQRAKEEVNAARNRLDSVETVRQEDVLAAKQAVQVAMANFQKADVDFKNSFVLAPTDGKVLKIHTKVNEAVGTNGIMEIGKTTQMYAVAEVDENLIGRVKPGQRAIVRSDAFQGEITGKVVAIGNKVGKNRITSTDPADSQDSRVVEVKIQLDSSEVVAGLSNLQVKVAIQP